jgi:hypothetical protein
VKNILRIAALAITCSATVVGQTGAESAKWPGTWVLNVSESKFGPFLMPGAPSDLAILSQTLKLEKTSKTIGLAGETTYSDSGGTHSSHDDTSLSLNGEETVIGPVSLSFKPVNESTFEIISKLKNSNPNLGEVSHFSVSPDGTKLIETKTQTEREVVTEGASKTTGAAIRVATSVLVFFKQPQK